MTSEIDNSVSSSLPPTNSSISGDKDTYQTVGLDTNSKKTTADHINALKDLSSLSDIQQYITAHIITPLKTQSPPNLSGIDRDLIDLIATASSNNKTLGAVLYHTIDNNLGYKLNIQNQQNAGQRKIVLNGSGKNIDDAIYTEIAKASQNIADYNNTYFSQKGGTPPTTPTPTGVPTTPIPTDASTTPTPTTPTPTTGKPKTEDIDDDSKSTDEPTLDIAPEMLKIFPDNTDFSKFNDVLVIDSKTGKKINPKKYDPNDPKEAKEFETLMARSITLYTKGNSDAVMDTANMQRTADALVEYITKPYETNFSTKALEDILDNFSLEASAEIFNLVQEKIIQSGNPAQIMKLKSYKNKNSDNGLDGIIGEMYNFNYLGSNSGNPQLFLLDMFASDATYKLQSTNISNISKVLGEHVTEYFANKDSDNEEDIKKRDISLAFITKTIELLAGTNNDEIGKKNIEKLLQAITANAGNNPGVKDFLTDMATTAGVDTFKTISIQTGQSLMSNFGEMTYTDDKGVSKTFSNSDTSGNFTAVQTDMIALLRGTHPSILANSDPTNPQGDLDAKAMTASQTADAIAMLSDTQQNSIIAELTEDDAIDLQSLASALPAPNPNLEILIQKIKFKDIIDDLKAAKTPEEKAGIFAEGIEAFTSAVSPQEMTSFINNIVGTETNFLGLNVSDYGKFTAKLTSEVADIEGATADTILTNLENSLNVKNIRFENDINGGEAQSATSLESTKDMYLDTLETGALTEDQAEAFLKGLTDDEKRDPDLWDDLFADRTFETATEYHNFVYSITRIAQKINENSTVSGFDTIKTNFTEALKKHKPIFTDTYKPSTFNAFPDGTYADHLANDNWFASDAGSGVKNYYQTTMEEFGGKKTFKTLLKENNGDVVETEKSLGNSVSSDFSITTKDDLALYANSIVDYVMEQYANDTVENRTKKLNELMLNIAKNLDGGSRYQAQGSSDQMDSFVRIMGHYVNKKGSGSFDTQLMWKNIDDNSEFARDTDASGMNKDDARSSLADMFRAVANGTGKVTAEEQTAIDNQSTSTPTPTPTPT